MQVIIELLVVFLIRNSFVIIDSLDETTASDAVFNYTQFSAGVNFFPECQSELSLEYSFLYSLHPPCNADCPSQCDTWGLWGRM